MRPVLFLYLFIESVRIWQFGYEYWNVIYTINGWRADKSKFEHIGVLGTSFEDELVDIAMKGVAGEIKQLIHLVPVVVNMFTFVAIFILVGVLEGENSSSTRV